jgi:hypothetical protein
MSPRERCEHNEGRSLGRNAQLLRTGRNSWYVVTPHAGLPDDPIAELQRQWEADLQ